MPGRAGGAARDLEVQHRVAGGPGVRHLRLVSVLRHHDVAHAYRRGVSTVALGDGEREPRLGGRPVVDDFRLRPGLSRRDAVDVHPRRKPRLSLDERHGLAPVVADRRVAEPEPCRRKDVDFRTPLFGVVVVLVGLPLRPVAGKLYLEAGREERVHLRGGVRAVGDGHGASRPRVGPPVPYRDVELEQEGRRRLARLEARELAPEGRRLAGAQRRDQLLRVRLRERDVYGVSDHRDSLGHAELRRGRGVPVVRHREVPRPVRVQPVERLAVRVHELQHQLRPQSPRQRGQRGELLVPFVDQRPLDARGAKVHRYRLHRFSPFFIRSP